MFWRTQKVENEWMTASLGELVPLIAATRRDRRVKIEIILTFLLTLLPVVPEPQLSANPNI